MCDGKSKTPTEQYRSAGAALPCQHPTNTITHAPPVRYAAVAPAQPLSRRTAVRGQTSLPPRCRRPSPARAPPVQNTAGGSRPTADQPHGGSLRAKAPANTPPTPSPACAPPVQNTAGGSRPTAGQPHGGSLWAKGPAKVRPEGAWHLQRKSQRIYKHPHHLVQHRGQSPRTRPQACNSGRWPDGRIVANRRFPRNRNDCTVAGDSPRSRRHRGNEVGRWPAKRARYGPKVHGTCSENPREFTGIRITWCGTGDSPRGHGRRRATAAVGRTVESSQTEDSPETATTVPLPGTVPTIADTGELRWDGGRQNGLVTTQRCMAPLAKIPENLLASASFGAAPETVPADTAAGAQQRPLAGR